MRRSVVLLLAVLALVTLVAIGVKMRATPPAATTGPADTVASAQQPEAVNSGEGVEIKFSDKPIAMPALALKDLDGAPLSPDAWKGKVVLLNFWATWCGPCREEIPMLIALQERYRGQLQVIGLSIDTGSPAAVKRYVQNAGVNYPIAIADDATQELFGGVSAVPSTFTITPEGAIIQRHVGLVDPRVLEHEVRVLAKLPSKATVQVVKDTGQVLLANAAYATEIPGLDLAHCTPEQREAVLKQLNTEKCTCGCGLTLAQCRINDPNCQTSLPIARQLLARIKR